MIINIPPTALTPQIFGVAWWNRGPCVVVGDWVDDGSKYGVSRVGFSLTRMAGFTWWRSGCTSNSISR